MRKQFIIAIATFLLLASASLASVFAQASQPKRNVSLEINNFPDHELAEMNITSTLMPAGIVFVDSRDSGRQQHLQVEYKQEMVVDPRIDYGIRENNRRIEEQIKRLQRSYESAVNAIDRYGSNNTFLNIGKDFGKDELYNRLHKQADNLRAQRRQENYDLITITAKVIVNWINPRTGITTTRQIAPLVVTLKRYYLWDEGSYVRVASDSLVPYGWAEGKILAPEERNLEKLAEFALLKALKEQPTLGKAF